MNVVKALRDYISKMVKITQGMKVLLLDAETSGIVSMVFSQSEVLQEEVYLFERIDTPKREVMAHMKAICFLRPTSENLALLKKELRKPKYGEYYLFFSNAIPPKRFLEQLASSDEHEVVQEVQEFFADYYAVNQDFFSLNLSVASTMVLKSEADGGSGGVLSRVVDGLFSLLLSLRIRPYVRVQKSSVTAKMIGNQLLEKMKLNKGLFQFRGQDVPPLLLILDRKDDPVTPLLSQWTYQAMIHEIIGLEKNLVDLSKCASNTKKELGQVVLSEMQDDFYRDNMYNNFGELGSSVRALVDSYSLKAKLNREVKSLEEMKSFIKTYPEFKKLSGNVSKHMAIMSELQAQVADRSLLDVSELEQGLACHEDHEAALGSLHKLLSEPKIRPADALRTVMLYSLRYERHPDNALPQLLEMLKAKGLPDEDIKKVYELLSYGGVDNRSRSIDLFANQSFFKKAATGVKRGLMGVTNIFTQHQPYLLQTIEECVGNSLPEATFPYLEGAPTKAKCQQILVFIVGGATYEEAAAVNSFNNNNNNPNVQVLLGGTSVINSTMFLQSLKHLSS